MNKFLPQITLAVTFMVLGLTSKIYASPAKASIQLAQATETEAQQAQWQMLAKISSTKAKEVAEAALGGTATSVSLADRNGSLVYEVVFGETKVIVDAGNGMVLSSERVASGNEFNDASFAPRSSVPIPDRDRYDQTTPNLNTTGASPQRGNAESSDSARSRNRIPIPGNSQRDEDKTTPFGSVLDKPEDASESESRTENNE